MKNAGRSSSRCCQGQEHQTERQSRPFASAAPYEQQRYGGKQQRYGCQLRYCHRICPRSLLITATLKSNHKVARVENPIAVPVTLGPTGGLPRFVLSAGEELNEISAVELAIKICVAQPRGFQVLDQAR